MHLLHLWPAVTSFPCALFVIPVPQERARHCLFFSTPSFSSPLYHLHLYFDAYVLFIHSSQIRSQEIRDICCTYFEDASCCSITCGAKVLVAFSGIGSAWLTGGGRLCAHCLINKIFYVNATKERERWDHWYIGLFGICIRGDIPATQLYTAINWHTAIKLSSGLWLLLGDSIFAGCILLPFSSP